MHAHFELLNRIAGTLAVIGFIGVVVLALLGPRGLDFAYVGSHYGIVLGAMTVGVSVTSIAFLAGIVIGFLVGWIRSTAAASPKPLGRSPIPWLVRQGAARVCYGYVELMRGTPILVQLFFVWSVLTIHFFYIGGGPIAIYAVIIALTINTGAYQGEIFRGGLQAVHHGQIEAARALGLRYWQIMRYVTLPQALRLILPPLTNEYIGLLKASALGYTVGLQDTTYWGVFLTQRSLKVFEVFAMVTASYLLVTLPLAWAVKYMERRLRIPGLGIQEEHEAAVRRAVPTKDASLAAQGRSPPTSGRIRNAVVTSAGLRRVFIGDRVRHPARGNSRDPLETRPVPLRFHGTREEPDA